MKWILVKRVFGLDQSTINGFTSENVNDYYNCMDEEAEYAEIGGRLRALREAHNMGQATWAELHGFNRTQYNNWERGIRRISLDPSYKLCEKHGVSLDWIYRGKEDGLSTKARKLLSSIRPAN